MHKKPKSLNLPKSTFLNINILYLQSAILDILTTQSAFAVQDLHSFRHWWQWLSHTCSSGIITVHTHSYTNGNYITAFNIILYLLLYNCLYHVSVTLTTFIKYSMLYFYNMSILIQTKNTTKKNTVFWDFLFYTTFTFHL